MSRKPKKGYFVRGHFVAEGSELDEELRRERDGEGPSKTALKAQSAELQALGEQILTLRAGLLEPLGLPTRLIDALQELARIKDFEGRRRQSQSRPPQTSTILIGLRMAIPRYRRLKSPRRRWRQLIRQTICSIWTICQIWQKNGPYRDQRSISWIYTINQATRMKNFLLSLNRLPLQRSSLKMVLWIGCRI